LYRVDAAYQRSESFRDSIFLDRIFLAPSVTWRPSDRTEFNVNVEYKPDRLRADTGVVAVGNRPAPIPISRYLGDPTIGHDRYEDVLVETSASHRLQANWTVRQHFVMDRISYDFNDLFPLGVLPDNRTLLRGMWIGNDSYRHWYAADLDLAGKFQAWGVDHSVLIGVNYTKADL
jgi:iron complex outermembrane receptor protein